MKSFTSGGADTVLLNGSFPKAVRLVYFYKWPSDGGVSFRGVHSWFR